MADLAAGHCCGELVPPFILPHGWKLQVLQHLSSLPDFQGKHNTPDDGAKPPRRIALISLSSVLVVGLFFLGIW